MSDKRDWQADRKLCEDFERNAGWAVRDLIAEQPQMSIYWLRQYAAEKERADKMISVLERIKSDIDEFRALTGTKEAVTVEEQASAFNRKLKADKDRADKAEAREQKLKEALETAQWCLMREAYMPAEDAIEDALRSIYQDTAVMDKEAEA